MKQQQKGKTMSKQILFMLSDYDYEDRLGKRCYRSHIGKRCYDIADLAKATGTVEFLVDVSGRQIEIDTIEELAHEIFPAEKVTEKVTEWRANDLHTVSDVVEPYLEEILEAFENSSIQWIVFPEEDGKAYFLLSEEVILRRAITFGEYLEDDKCGSVWAAEGDTNVYYDGGTMYVPDHQEGAADMIVWDDGAFCVLFKDEAKDQIINVYGDPYDPYSGSDWYTDLCREYGVDPKPASPEEIRQDLFEKIAAEFPCRDH
jgi:hypothetical protein